MSTTNSQEMLDQTIPQWKRELILRRRATARTLPAGNNSAVKLTCPSVVTAVRYPDITAAGSSTDIQQRCIASNKAPAEDFHPTRGRSDSSSPAAAVAAVGGNMRLVEHLGETGLDVVFNGGGLDPNISLDPVTYRSKMGEEKAVKISNSVSTRTVMDNSVISLTKKRVMSNENTNGNHVDNEECQSDSSEELQYGPGIVNKLKSKYLSMTLRENQNRGIRPSISNMRRFSSLENMLDNDDLEAGKPQIKAPTTGFVKRTDEAVSHQRFRPTTRRKESMKRARSVETLHRYDGRSQGVARNVNRPASHVNPLVNDEIVIVESTPKPRVPEGRAAEPRKRSSNRSEAELPRPDVVKQTLKLFEGAPPVNKKMPAVRPPTKYTNQNHAKVTIQCKTPPSVSVKPAVSPKPPLSPRKTPPPKTLPPETPPPARPCLLLVDKPCAPEPPDRRVNSPSPTYGVRLTNGKSPVRCPTAEPESLSSEEEETVDGPVVKVVSRTALENIRRDGMSMQFSFNGASETVPTDIAKSYLPGGVRSPAAAVPPRVRALESPLKSPASPVKSPGSPQTQTRQVGVIRPILSHAKVRAASPPLSLTDLEIEKNHINRVKSTTEPPPDATSKGPGLWDKKQPWNQPQNTVVFNFSSRKDPVPDYIENDGLILRGRREKPKPGESGVILLGGASEESSTDYEEEFAPPSPCDVEFEGGNVVINGRSNLLRRPKAHKLRISFNDSLTATFEYPSESSLLDDAPTSPPPALPSSPGVPAPLGGGLASFTPSKMQLGSEDFQLGVTRATAPAPAPAPRPPPSESEVDDYLKPAEDADTVAWSAETAADLLF